MARPGEAMNRSDDHYLNGANVEGTEGAALVATNRSGSREVLLARLLIASLASLVLLFVALCASRAPVRGEPRRTRSGPGRRRHHPALFRVGRG